MLATPEGISGLVPVVVVVVVDVVVVVGAIVLVVLVVGGRAAARVVVVAGRVVVVVLAGAAGRVVVVVLAGAAGRVVVVRACALAVSTMRRERPSTARRGRDGAGLVKRLERVVRFGDVASGVRYGDAVKRRAVKRRAVKRRAVKRVASAVVLKVGAGRRGTSRARRLGDRAPSTRRCPGVKGGAQSLRVLACSPAGRLRTGPVCCRVVLDALAV